MRPKVVAGVLLVALGLLGIAALASRLLRPQTGAAPVNTPAGLAADHQPAPAREAEPAGKATETNAAKAANPATITATNISAAERSKNVGKRVAELNALAMNDDPASRDAILMEMRNPDKEIRAAALEAAIQFGDRSVVPRLQEIAAQTEDPAEKTAILEAIDYINLPSLTEYGAQQKATKELLGIPDSTPNSTNAVRRSHRSQRAASERQQSSPVGQ